MTAEHVHGKESDIDRRWKGKEAGKLRKERLDVKYFVV